MNLDSRIDTFLTPIANKVSGVIFSHVTINGVRVEFLIALLIIAAVYFTLRTRFAISLPSLFELSFFLKENFL